MIQDYVGQGCRLRCQVVVFWIRVLNLEPLKPSTRSCNPYTTALEPNSSLQPPKIVNLEDPGEYGGSAEMTEGFLKKSITGDFENFPLYGTGKGLQGHTPELYGDCHRDPFPHSLH